MAEQNNQKKGKLAVISGFSGSGKGTLINTLLQAHDNYVLSVSMTTRQPREGEVDGVHYFFETNEEFEKAIKNDEFLEYAGYVNHYYGTPASFVNKKIEEGKDVLLEIEVQGAMQIKEKMPEAILIFIVPPTAQDLVARLMGRGTEDNEVILKRLAMALIEAESMPKYDYVLVNDKLEESAELLDRIIQTEPDESHYDAKHMGVFTNELREILMWTQIVS